MEKPETIHTADAAKASGVDLNQLTKSLILIDSQNQLVLAIIPGNCQLDIKKVEAIFQLKKLRLVPFNLAENYSGYLPGATPPLGHKRPMKVIVDKKLLAFDTIFGCGGNKNQLVELKTQDVIQLNKASIGEISIS